MSTLENLISLFQTGSHLTNQNLEVSKILVAANLLVKKFCWVATGKVRPAVMYWY